MRKENSSTKRRLKGSYLISLLSIMLVLFVLSLFSSLMLFSNKISDYIKENIGVKIELKKNAKEKDVKAFQAVMEKQPYVKSMEFISKDDALNSMKEELGEDIMVWLGDVGNPLPASIDIKLKSEYANNDSIAKIEQWVKKKAVVNEVIVHKSMVETIDHNVNSIATALLIVGGVLLIMAVTLISHTVRLSVYSKRFVVRSMQLVGATEGFIIKPFMKHFIIQGLIGALLSLVLVTLVLYEAVKNIPELMQLSSINSIVTIYVMVIILGVVLTSFSTYIAMRKYLRANIDDLYE